MNVNDTSMTAVIFLGMLLVIGLIWTAVGVERGEIEWPPWKKEVVEKPKPNPMQYVGARPSFGARAQTLLRDEVPTAEPEPMLRMPPLNTLGLALSLIGIGWLLVESFSQGTGWGCAVLFGNILGGLIFMCAYPQRAWRPFSLQLVGYLTVIWAAVGPGVS